MWKEDWFFRNNAQNSSLEKISALIECAAKFIAQINFIREKNILLQSWEFKCFLTNVCHTHMQIDIHNTDGKQSYAEFNSARYIWGSGINLQVRKKCWVL